MSKWFSNFAAKASYAVGHWSAFTVATILTILWFITGPFFRWSDTWQLYINTTSTISTGLIVFLIQNQQNRSDHAIHVKLDAMAKALDNVSNKVVGIENKTEEEISEIETDIISTKEE